MRAMIAESRLWDIKQRTLRGIQMQLPHLRDIQEFETLCRTIAESNNGLAIAFLGEITEEIIKLAEYPHGELPSGCRGRVIALMAELQRHYTLTENLRIIGSGCESALRVYNAAVTLAPSARWFKNGDLSVTSPGQVLEDQTLRVPPMFGSELVKKLVRDNIVRSVQ